MSKAKDAKNKLKSKLKAIQAINDDPKKAVDNVYDLYLKDLPTTDKLFGKKLDEFLEKRKKKNDNNKDIFSELIDVVEGFLHTDKKVEGSEKLMSKQRIKQHAQDATNKTLEQSKNIILENVKKTFFAGEGICGKDAFITVDSITLKPNEFDFLNMYKVDPSTPTGELIYESASPIGKKLKVNRSVYNSFTSGNYQFDTNSNRTLFKMNWNDSNQEFILTGLTQGLTNLPVESFFNDYYSSIEMPDITGITKNAMLLTLKGDPSQDPLFDKGLNDLDRLLKKLFAICGNPQPTNNLLKNTTTEFNENDEDIEFYFNFDDVEGIDLDDEDARRRKVLRFTDCSNFEIPVNTDIIEDFVYLSKKKPLNDFINTTLSKTASDAYEQSDSSIPVENFHLSILNTYILQLPKALIMSLLSPKIFLPIVVIYKIFKMTAGQVIKAAELMKKLFKLFWAIIKDLFWTFIREFWNLIKPDLLRFVINLIKKILKNKKKRYILMITALIALLYKLLEEGIDNCYALFNVILTTLDGALSIGGLLNIPGILLGLSDKLPGYSTDSASMNAFEKMEAAGVNLGAIFGESNDLRDVVKGLIEGHQEEMDTHGFVQVSNKEIIIPTPVGPIIIPPGILNSAGKVS